MSETKFVDYKKLENANGSLAGTMRIPVEVDEVGTDSKGNPIFEPVAQSGGASGGLAPNTIIHADWVNIWDAGLNPAIVVQSEVPPQAAFPASGRYSITVVNQTGVALEIAYFNYEDLDAFYGGTEPHAVLAGILSLPAGDSLDDVYVAECPPGFLYCEGFESLINPGTGIVQGRVEVRLQGATVSVGRVGYVIRAV